MALPQTYLSSLYLPDPDFILLPILHTMCESIYVRWRGGKYDKRKHEIEENKEPEV